MTAGPRCYALKAGIGDLRAVRHVFPMQKTMYGGKHIAAGDRVFLFASEHEGGAGLFARGIVAAGEALPRRTDVDRQTPRVSVVVDRIEAAVRRLGRAELRAFSDWDDGAPETELNFKLYRQATNKIVGLTDPAAAFLGRFFADA